MAKRFIDTELWKDEWFSDLSRDGKMFFFYYITNCDHAGFLKLNKKLIYFQTEIEPNSIDTVIKEFGNRLVTVSEQLLFYPKYLLFQHSKGLYAGNKPQKGIISLLSKYGIDNEKLYSYSKLFGNSYITVQDKDKDKDKDKDINSKVVNTSSIETTTREENLKPRTTSKKKTDWREDERFMLFWDTYGNKIDVVVAYKSWKKVNPDEKLFQQIIESAKRYKELCDAGTPQKHASTWLNNQCWLNDYQIQKQSVSPNATMLQKQNQRIERPNTAGKVTSYGWTPPYGFTHEFEPKQDESEASYRQRCIVWANQGRPKQ